MRSCRSFFFVLSSLALASAAFAQGGSRPSAKMLQQPDVSAKDIVFVYANDLWLVGREGGMARPLASPPGRETFPKFSPDGKSIAYVGNYEGNRDVYVIPAEGGLSARLTYHPANEVITDWTPDGRVIYFAAGQGGLQRQEQLFTIATSGGQPTRLPVPYGAMGTVSPDGSWLAYTPSTADFRTWKRYRGGWAQDIWLFNLKDQSSKKITDWEGTDTIPMWQPGKGETLYYLSDDGPAHRLNIWSYTIKSGERSQATDFKDYDIKWPSIGPGQGGKGEIVFQNGEDLYLMDLSGGGGGGKTRKVEVIIPGDRPKLREQSVDAAKFIQIVVPSPSGKRVAIEARGDIWTVPAIEGVTRNLTRTSGVADRDPMFSPDGKWIAYLSDATGEYEMYLIDADGKTQPKQLTKDGGAYRYMQRWSPDSKHIVFGDKIGTLYLHTLGGKKHDGSADGTTKLVAREQWANLQPFSWSGDSAWIAITLGGENTQSQIWLYEVATGTLTPATSEMFDSSWPAFDQKGDFLYFSSSRTFEPTYSDIDGTWVYRGGEKIYAIPLNKEVKNPLAPKSDEEEAKKDDKKDEKKDADKKDKPAYAGTWKGTGKEGAGEPFEITLKFEVADDGAITGTTSAVGEEFKVRNATWDKETKTLTFDAVGGDVTYSVKATIEGETLKATWTAPGDRSGTVEAKREADEKKPVKIDLEGLESRAIELPIKAGNFTSLSINDSGKLVYMRAGERPRGGGDDDAGAGDIKIFDLLDEKPKKEEKTVIAGVDGFQLTADGKKLLVRKGEDYAVVDSAPDQKMEKKVPLNAMTLMVNPREEWHQMFTDCWRIFRDFFYDPGMHQVDWKASKEAYGKLLDDCASREDVTFVIAELISELNVGHAYYRVQDADAGPTVAVGMLGADFAIETQDGITAYRIQRILRGGPWDIDARSPLAMPGVDVNEGDFILAVNRAPIDVSKDIFASFLGTTDKPTSITVSATPVIDDKAREVIVKPMANEGTLRMRDWIEMNRRYVEEKSEGKIGYIYVINTGVPGQSDLVRQFYGQRHKAALIIDDRWNGGGQIPNRFIELLNRPRSNYWARRDGKDWAWPRDSHQGPKCMLINGQAGSGGDMFPALFKQAGLGKLIGRRTWGGLVGISGNPQLIDGTGPNVPTFGYYQTDGTWGIEGHGVDPDIDVIDDPAKMIAPMGIVADPQLDTAITHLLGEIQTTGYHPPPRPAYPDRKGMGLPDSDK